MIQEKAGISMGKAALITALPLFIPAAPYAEFYVFGKLIKYNDALQTTQNLVAHPKLFLSGIFAMVFIFVYDIVLAWSLYIFLKPVNAAWSLLAAWFRLVYTALAFVALFNFTEVYHLTSLPAIDAADKQEQVMQLVNARRFGMSIAYIVFGFYLILTGILISLSTYIPKLLGVLIVLAGISWIMISLQPYFFSGYNFSWMMILATGELFFAIWLLVKGTRIKESELVSRHKQHSS